MQISAGRRSSGTKNSKKIQSPYSLLTGGCHKAFVSLRRFLINIAMQQLTLFNDSAPRGPRVRGNKRAHNNTRRAQAKGIRWDLWTQEAEAEKEMALFFLDIRNFTPLVEKHQAFDVIHIIKKLFSSFQNIIRIHRGRIIETSGDGFYAAFGFDRNVNEAVNEAVQAGIAILKTLENLNTRSFEKTLHQRIEVGIGVHVGKVATGNLHLGSQDHFVIMGYPVNVASRLQAATKELNNNFIVSAAVFKLLENPRPDIHPITVNLKGVTDPCEVHLIGRSYAA
jgi:class 3 adenylate cyclase